ncbi:hypothetical protein SAMN06295900_102125 [Trinickia caryophylli]|uniref:Uncharacterized protein n=1 Tax=Trinickia caryophylli TaxID=28094 RepID=A0A1X7CXT9_TRICW|nr:hypothetical protein SAMN06295900_102125 [Trinickia caryophylli]
MARRVVAGVTIPDTPRARLRPRRPDDIRKRRHGHARTLEPECPARQPQWPVAWLEAAGQCVRRHAPGVCPTIRLKIRVKWAWSLKPYFWAISAVHRGSSLRSDCAAAMRTFNLH